VSVLVLAAATQAPQTQQFSLTDPQPNCTQIPSTTTTLKVAAHFKSKIRTELVRLGQTARLKCESFGDLPIEISWLKDKLPLYGQEEPRYSLTNTQLQDGILSELVVHETTRTDSALFTCITQNQFGTDDTNIQLVVQGPPDPPEELRVHDYGARSAKVSWSPGHSGNSPIIRYVLMYAPVAQLATVKPTGYQDYPPLSVQPQPQHQPQWINVTIQGNETSHLLQGLVPLTEYHCHLVAVNALGASRLSNEPIKFRTDDETPSLPPAFVKAQAISSRSIRVRWRAPERRRDQHYGLITGFYVGYKLHRPAAGNSNPQQQQASAAQSGTGERATTGSLGQTGDAMLAKQHQETFVYKTIEFNQRPASSESLLSTSIATAQPAAGLQPPASSSSNNNNNITKNGVGLEFECQLNSLKRGQKYLITVQPFNARGTGPSSEAVLAETWRVDVPDPPSLRMIARTSHSIHLAWRLAPPATAAGMTTAGRQEQAPVKLNPAAFKAAAAAAQGQHHSRSGAVALQFDQAAALHSEPAAGARFESQQQQQQQQQHHLMPSARLDELLQMSPEELAAEEAQANEPILGFVLTRKQLPPAPAGPDQISASLAHHHHHHHLHHAIPDGGASQMLAASSSAQQSPSPATAAVADNNQPSVELRLPSDHTTHIVDNLACGTRYQFTIAAINSVGVSPPSEPLVVKTEGSLPVAPDRNSLLSLNASSVVINLGAWHNGTCSMRSFDVLYKPSRSKKWTTLTSYQFGQPAPQQQQQQMAHSSSNDGGPNQVAPVGSSSASDQQHSPRSLTTSTTSGGANNFTDASQMARSSASDSRQTSTGHHYELQPENGTIVLDNLATSINYDLKILATNEAGTTEALYTFNTNGNSISSLDQQWSNTGGEFQFSDTSLNELFASTGSITALMPVLLLLLLVSLTLSTGCIVFARRRRSTSSNCSLSGSSRSNQSSANYCGTTTTTTTTTTNAALQNGGGSGREQQMLCGVGDLKGATLMSHAGNRRMLALDHASGGSLDDSPLLVAPHHAHQQQQQQQQQHQNAMRLNEIYGTQQRPVMQSAAPNKSHYAYLTTNRMSSAQQQHPNRSSSPHNTDITSVLNGSEETEMCLGASALNLSGAGTASQQPPSHETGDSILATTQNGAALQQLYNSNTLNHNKGALVNSNYFQQQQQQQQPYQLPGGKLANQLMGHMGKSSTLPSGCHQQQMMQKLVAVQQQQQQQTSDPAGQQQAIIDSIMAANLHQQELAAAAANGCQESAEAVAQQQAAAAAAYALQAALQAANNGQQASFDRTMLGEALNLANMNMLDPANHQSHQQQHHHHHHHPQVYATVKRGCPRPPPAGPQQQRQPLCDYTGTIYQCPDASQRQQHQHEQQMLMGGCCSGQASSSGIGSDGNQTSSVMFCFDQSGEQQQQHQDQTTTGADQQGQHHYQSDYQQLRPIE
jgi:hypothetical protein